MLGECFGKYPEGAYCPEGPGREVRSVDRLRHDSGVRVFYFGELDPVDYIPSAYTQDPHGDPTEAFIAGPLWVEVP